MMKKPSHWMDDRGNTVTREWLENDPKSTSDWRREYNIPCREIHGKIVPMDHERQLKIVITGRNWLFQLRQITASIRGFWGSIGTGRMRHRGRYRWQLKEPDNGFRSAEALCTSVAVC